MAVKKCGLCPAEVPEETLNTIEMKSSPMFAGGERLIDEKLLVCDYCFGAVAASIAVEGLERLPNRQDDIPRLG